MKGASEFTKDPQWQSLRKSLLGQWTLRPDWCILQLKKYIGNIHTSDERRLKQTLNYLTGSGFRTGRISSKEYPEISKLRAEISAELKKRKFIKK